MDVRHVPGLRAFVYASCLLRDARQLLARGHLRATCELLEHADTLALHPRQEAQLERLWAGLLRTAEDVVEAHRRAALTGASGLLPFRAMRLRTRCAISSAS